MEGSGHFDHRIGYATVAVSGPIRVFWVRSPQLYCPIATAQECMPKCKMECKKKGSMFTRVPFTESMVSLEEKNKDRIKKQAAFKNL